MSCDETVKLWNDLISGLHPFFPRNYFLLLILRARKKSRWAKIFSRVFFNQENLPLNRLLIRRVKRTHFEALIRHFWVSRLCTSMKRVFWWFTQQLLDADDFSHLDECQNCDQVVKSRTNFLNSSNNFLNC